MSRTLNYTVQRVLEKLNLDPVSSISDTEDSVLVSREAETTFYDMLTRAEWKSNLDLVKVESVSDLNNPTALRLKDKISSFGSIRYDVTTTEDEYKNIRTLVWLEPEDFLEKIFKNNTGKDHVQVVDYKGVSLFIDNDKMPDYYTSFDNEHLILDSYHKETEDTVVGSKTVAYAEVEPSWINTDEFIIPIQESLYPLYLSSLASACSVYMNSEVSREDERRQARGMSRMRREQNRTELEYFPKFHYGRKGNGLA